MKNASLCALVVSVISFAMVAGAVQATPATHLNDKVVTSSQALRVSANVTPGEGAPMPTCYPGKNCGADSQQQTIAGEGAPMPTCYPGKNCGADSQQQTIALVGMPYRPIPRS